MTQLKEVTIIEEKHTDDDREPDTAMAPDESTPLLLSSQGASARSELFQSFRRQRSSARLLSLRVSSGGVARDGNFAEPVEALAPLFPSGIESYLGRKFVPYREASLVKSVPAFAPYRRKERHRNFHLYWTNEFRHWWKSSRLLVRLGGLYVYSFDSTAAPAVLLLDPEKHKTIKKLVKFAKMLGQGGDEMRIFLKTVKPFTRTMRILVGGWRWVEAAPCRRGEVGLEEFMAFVGNRVSRLVARTFTDVVAADAIFPIQRFLFRKDFLIYPMDYHPITVCVCIGIFRAISPFAASFQGSRIGRVLTRRFFSSSKNRWLPVQRIGELNLLSDDCQERDEVSQTADLVIIARMVAKALGLVQVDDKARQHEVLMDEGFEQIGAGAGGYAVYQYHYQSKSYALGSTTILLHVTPYGPSITDVMPYYTVLEYETSFDRRDKWSEFVSKSIMEGPPVVEGYCYQGAFFSPHHFAELKDMYDQQLLTYEAACKKLPIVSKSTRHGGPPRDLPTLKTFLESGKRGRKVKQNSREFNQLQKVVTTVAKEILRTLKREKRDRKDEGTYAPKGVILYFEGLDCSGKSSTGGLVQAALEKAGYQVAMRQYNRPPTAEQRARPWMDRFEVPSDTTLLDLTSNADDEKTDDDDVRIGLVWDRGPAGDFVYGNLNELPLETKLKRYKEFRDFDRQCREQGILFLKLLFVTNRDSIARTLGKRLAQKKMAKDLQTWLQACSSRSGSDVVSFEGLEAIAAHIDPTDFIAFNNYERNLRIFSNFALNTDTEANPWVVVNTGDRFAARKALMQAFRNHLEDFRRRGKHCSPCCVKDVPEHSDAVEIEDMMKFRFRMTWRHSMLAWITFMGLLLLAFIYAENTDWEDSWYRTPTKYDINELLNNTVYDDDTIVVTQKTGKTSKNDVETADKNVLPHDDVAQKKGKTVKKDIETKEGSKEKEDATEKASKKM
ncbi:hypothetical protein HJC23_002150 [Cyclotella cryptica]|uniref:Thymidylate kinase-like domain-containing protein n=1 Tax=Cyclotella cryptica TaxID=29204 RepID=A0ABD3Q5P0_9STRA